MNKLFTKIASIALGLSMAIGVGVAIGGREAKSVGAADNTVSWTASSGALGSTISKLNGTATGTITLSGGGQSFTMDYTRKLEALASGKSDYVAWQDSTWIQLGSGNASESIVFETSSIPGTIKSISIQAATNGSHTYTMQVGDTKYATSLSLGTYSGTITSTNPKPSDTTKTGTGTSSGKVTISINPGTRKAMIINSVSVTYNNDTPVVSTYTVTYNPNSATSGSVPTDGTAYSSGATVTVLGNTGSLARVAGGFTFDFSGWNTKADGTGTNYTAGDTFSISDNITLYAKWTYTPDAGAITYDLGSNSSFSSWTATYGSHTLSYTTTDVGSVSVVFTSANKPSSGSAVEGMPVTKGSDVEFKLTSTTHYISAITLNAKQWSDKAQTMTLHYSTNGGSSYTSTGTTSDFFAIRGSSFGNTTNAVKITFSTSNQIGIENFVVTYAMKKTLSSIAVKTPPDKTKYIYNEDFDPTGLVITLTYSTTETEDVSYSGHESSFSFSPAKITATGNVTITYATKTCTQAVTLLTVKSVTGVHSAPSYIYVGDSISTSDVVLDVLYSDDVTTGTVNPDHINVDNSAVVASTVATAWYTAAETDNTKKATFNIEVKKVPVYDYIVDEIVLSDTGITGNTYTAWSGVSKPSGAVYAGTTNENDSGGIGMRASSASGIYVTTSPGVVTKVEVVWTTTLSRTLYVFGQDTAYSQVYQKADMTGTEIGSITYSSTSTTTSSEYKYIALCVTGGAAGFSKIKITWKVEGAEYPLTDNPVLSTGSTANAYVGKNLALEVTTVPAYSDEKLIATSSNESYATVTGSGKNFTIHGVAVGEATITIKGAKGTYQSSVVVTVSVAQKTYEDKVILPGTINVTGKSYSDNNSAPHDYDGVSFKTYQVQLNGGAFSFQAGAGYIQNEEVLYTYNNGANNASIKSITLFMNSENEGTVTMYEGTAKDPSTSLAASTTTGNVKTYIFSSNMTYFRIAETGGSKLLKIDRFVIELNDSCSDVLAEARSASQIIINGLKDSCGDNKSGVVTQSQWDSINASLAAMNDNAGLSASAKQLLREADRITLDNVSQGSLLIENAMAHYDACVTKFGYTPYSGITNATPSGARIMFGSVITQNNSITIITVITLISVSAVGGYFLLRKRKED